MKRRDFLTMSSGEQTATLPGNPKTRVFAGLETQTDPMTRAQVLHLLRRVTFGPSQKEVDKFVGMTPLDALDILLGDGTEPLPDKDTEPMLKDWINKLDQNPLKADTVSDRGTFEAIMKNRYKILIDWIIARMRDEDVTTGIAREKFSHFLTSFWCIEFSYDTRAFIPPQLLFRHNQSLRKNSIGFYNDIAKDMTLDGAFILYQSMQASEKNFPNENFARELLELFTMGIGYNGEENYTEVGDIQNISKVLTGWRTQHFQNEPGQNGPFETYFKASDHHIGKKTMFGETIPARDESENTEGQVREEEIGKLIDDILFVKRAEAISHFVCDKIYRFFVYSNAAESDETIIAELAQIFRDNDFSLALVYRTLFSSQHFFAEENIGIQIKTPVEFFVGIDRLLGTSYNLSQDALIESALKLYKPPNVGGWDGYRTWISTITYSARMFHGKAIVEQMSDEDVLAFTKSIPSYDNADVFLNNLAELFFPKSISSGRLFRYKKDFLLRNGVTEELWQERIESGNGNAIGNVRNLIVEFILSPDIQLS
jgi:uncharacterized protein (DUF1800 family)